MRIGLHRPSIGSVHGFEQMVMVVPIDHQVDETQKVAKKHRAKFDKVGKFMSDRADEAPGP